MDPTAQQVKSGDISAGQVEKLKQKVALAQLPDDLRHNVDERIQRLEYMRSSSAVLAANYILEYESTYSYVNWVTSLPWNTETKDILDLKKAKEVLDKNHHGLNDVKDRILEYLSSLILNISHNNTSSIGHAPILCLVGLAGTGKTTLAFSIAEALGRKFERIPFGGMGSAQALRGQSRLLPDAEPGFIIKKLAHANSKNSVFLLDELDRVSDAARSDIMGVLVELLDPEQHKAFSDHYIDYPFDLSNILFIATGNTITHVATAVLDRLEIIQMPSYTDDEKIVIAKQYLFPKTKIANGLLENQLTIEDGLWLQIVRPLGFDSGIRSLERTIEGVCRKAARHIVEGKAQTIALNATNIKEYLPHF